MLSTIGTSVLTQAFKDAAYMLSHPNGTGDVKYRGLCSDALLFIQGTGLEKMLTQFYMDYNPDSLRRTFFTSVHRQDKIE